MERPPPPDPNALTQPIPVVPVPPPPRASVATVVPAAYADRFGNIPWYLTARLAAFVLDYFAIAFVVATFAFHVTESGFVLFAGRNAAGFATLAAASFGFAILFAFVNEAAFGTTLGKLVFALHVRRRDGRHAGGGRVLLRTLVRPIDIVLVGPLLALVTPRHQRFGDLIAGTVVAGSRLGVFASLLGLTLAGAIAYAQIAFGGGLTSAIGVAAETANYAPDLAARAATVLGLPQSFVPRPISQPSVSATGSPQAQSTDGASVAPARSGTSNI